MLFQEHSAQTRLSSPAKSWPFQHMTNSYETLYAKHGSAKSVTISAQVMMVGMMYKQCTADYKQREAYYFYCGVSVLLYIFMDTTSNT